MDNSFSKEATDWREERRLAPISDIGIVRPSPEFWYDRMLKHSAKLGGYSVKSGEAFAVYIDVDSTRCSSGYRSEEGLHKLGVLRGSVNRRVAYVSSNDKEAVEPL
jgi:hypothetical protein